MKKDSNHNFKNFSLYAKYLGMYATYMQCITRVSHGVRCGGPTWCTIPYQLCHLCGSFVERDKNS